MTYFQEGRNFHTFQEEFHNAGISNRSVKRTTTHLKTVSPENTATSQEYSTFYEEFKILFWMARALGVFPYHVDESGELSIKLCSIELLYSVAVVTCVAVTSAYVTIDWKSHLKSGINFRESVNIYTLWLFIDSYVLIPLNHWPEMWKKVRFINNWKKFQHNFAETTGNPPRLEMRRKLATALVCYAAIEVFVVAQICLGNLIHQWWHVFIYLHVFALLFLMPGIWVFTCVSFSKMADLLSAEIKKDARSPASATAHRLKQYRKLWSRLSELTEELGTSSGITFGGITLLLFTASLLFAYSFLVTIESHFNYALFCVIVWINVVIFAQCDAARAAMDTVGSSFSKSIEALTENLPANDVANIQELRILLSTIARNRPVISFANFVTVNRGLFVSLISTTMTDLIVLVQFQISDDQDTKKQNNTS